MTYAKPVGFQDRLERKKHLRDSAFNTELQGYLTDYHPQNED